MSSFAREFFTTRSYLLHMAWEGRGSHDLIRHPDENRDLRSSSKDEGEVSSSRRKVGIFAAQAEVPIFIGMTRVRKATMCSHVVPSRPRNAPS